jgi:hypothetical protein
MLAKRPFTFVAMVMLTFVLSAPPTAFADDDGFQEHPQ